MVLPFFSPLSCFAGIAGPEETKNPAGKDALRLIQIRVAGFCPEYRESVNAELATFPKRQPPFVTALQYPMPRLAAESAVAVF
jgi:hypothetical protein